MEKNKKKHKHNTNSKSNTEVLNSKEGTKEKKAVKEKELTKENETIKQEDSSAAGTRKEPDKAESVQSAEAGGKRASSAETEERKQTDKKDFKNEAVAGQEIMSLSSENIRAIAVNILKILLPVAACAIVIAVVISYAGSKKTKEAEQAALNLEEKSEVTSSLTLSSEPLEENVYEDVNELMRSFYTALADGDMDTVTALKDYNDDTEIITYQEKSEFIESYDNLNCYTKPGLEENSYFVYVSYDVKIKDIETKAPGLTAFYVYTAEDGSLKIDGNREENVTAAFKLVTNQDDVVDLYKKIDVNYKEAIASDEALNSFLTELPAQIKTSVAVALAELETQNAAGGEAQTETETASDEETQTAETETASESEEPLQNQVVNQIVRTTDTVNVRTSDSEEADKIDKVPAGTELTRIEDRINGWSKVIYGDREAYIKSDYLEVVSTETTEDAPVPAAGYVTAKTNVNVRNAANQEADTIGTAQAQNSYELVEDQGEWLKINYNGSIGFVKAEFFEK